MATKEIRYLTYLDALLLHFREMRRYGETRYGVFDRTLIESALARPQHAAAYEQADLIRQAATLCFGLIKNHPWLGGNKRTATALTEVFLRLNGWKVTAEVKDKVALVLAVESDQYSIDDIEIWYRQHTHPLVTSD